MSDAGTLHFRLPTERWQQADPERTREAGVAYLAYRTGDGPFVANITVTGRVLAEELGLEGVADAAYEDVLETSPGATLDRRETYGSDAAPGLLQLVSLTVDDLELQQVQVFVRARNRLAHEAGSQVAALLYLVVLTGLRDEVREAVPELQEFLRSIEVEAGA